MSKRKKVNVAKSGNTVKVHYKGTLEDGSIFDSSYDRGQTLSFKLGDGQMIKGFDSAVSGMKIGQKKKVKIDSDSAYGPVNPGALRTVPKTLFPEAFDFVVGNIVEGQGQQGQPLIARIESLAEEEVILDFNHPMAGKDLNFEIELVEIED